MLQIRYTKQALKGLSRAPAKVQKAIVAKIALLAENPQRSDLDIKKMKGGTGRFRLRVGTYRVLYSEDGTILDVLNIGPRGGIYGN